MPSPVPGTRATGTNRTSLCPQGLPAGLAVAGGGGGGQAHTQPFQHGEPEAETTGSPRAEGALGGDLAQTGS